jgi:hypothetical protein
MRMSRSIKMVQSPLDRTIQIDPAVHYRPQPINGRRYLISVDEPKPRTARPTGAGPTN